MDQPVNQHAGAWAIVGASMWLAYGVLSGANHWLGAGLVGFAIAMLIVGAQYRRAAVKIMDCTALAYFALVIAIAVIGGDAWLQRFRLPFPWSSFAFVAWLTIVIGAPFTLQYAREQAPPESWVTPTFRQMNLYLSVVWALIFTISTILGFLSIAIGYPLLLGLILPMGLLAFGFIFSGRYPKRFFDQIESETRIAGTAPRPDAAETMGSTARS